MDLDSCWTRYNFTSLIDTYRQFFYTATFIGELQLNIETCSYLTLDRKQYL